MITTDEAPMIYLASPHYDPDEVVRELRYEQAMKATARLLCEGKWVYSPIVHYHEIARKHGLPNGFSFWKEYDEHMLGLAEAMYVLRLEGWNTSRGIASEIGFATKNQIPIYYIDD